MADSEKQNIKAVGKNIDVDARITHVHNANPLTSERLERIIKLERKDAIEEHEKASDAEKVKLEQKIAELDRRLADLPQAFEDAQAQIAELKAKLEREGNEIGAEKLAVAITALEQGDFSKADELFAEIETREELAVKRSARAAFARGEIAQQEVRWHDALEHYTRAAQLAPSFNTLIRAQTLAIDVGAYDSALSLGLAAKKVAIKEYGKDTQQYAHSLNNIGSVYSECKKNELAEPLYEEALKINQNVLGKTHPYVATGLNNLGRMYQIKNQHRKATHFLKRALNIHKKAFGLKHPVTATTISNLGGSYKALGEFKEAETLFKKVLKIRKEILGLRHPATANSFNSLGDLYRVQRKYTKAEPYFKQAVEIIENTLGSDHPDTKLFKQNYEYIKEVLANT